LYISTKIVFIVKKQINKLNYNTMGCGCKNNGNQSQQPSPQQVQQAAAQRQQTNESVKAAIKKTVEKYYNVNKTSK
jgi:hypothetical protein